MKITGITSSSKSYILSVGGPIYSVASCEVEFDTVTMADDEDEVLNLENEVALPDDAVVYTISMSGVRTTSVDSRRIDNQEGAFIVCGLLEETYGGKKYNTLSNLRLKLDNKKITICIIDKKAELLNELESLGINKAKIYPEIDDVADYIKTHVNIPT